MEVERPTDGAVGEGRNHGGDDDDGLNGYDGDERGSGGDGSGRCDTGRDGDDGGGPNGYNGQGRRADEGAKEDEARDESRTV